MKQEAIDKLTEKALEYLNSAEAFVGKEVPQYIEELVNFKIIEHLIEFFDGIVILGGLFVLSAIISFICYKLSRRKDSDGDYVIVYTLIITPIIITVALLFSLFINTASSVNELTQAYKAYKAPRVYLVEYFTGKIK